MSTILRDLDIGIRETELRLVVLREGLAMPRDDDAIEREQRLLDHLLSLRRREENVGRMKELWEHRCHLCSGLGSYHRTNPPETVKCWRCDGTGQVAPAVLPDYQHMPGFKEKNATSEAAAKAMAPRAGTLRDQALDEIKRLPGTPDEIAARLGKSVLAIRPRITELIAMGLVRKSGKTRPNESGHPAAVIEAV